MTDLDLDRIKKITADLDDESCSDSVWTQRAIRVVAQVPRMIAELERYQRLLATDPYPTADAYDSMSQALADERAAVVQHCDRIEVLENLLAEILDRFPKPPYPDVEVRSGRVREETLDRWRSHLERAS